MLFTITSFAYSNAKFNAIGNDYVRKPELEALIEARSFQDAVGILATHNYPVKDAKDIDDAENLLDDHNIKTIEDILHDIPTGLHPFIKAYLKKYEVGVVKRVLKQHLTTSGRARVGAMEKDKSGKAPGVRRMFKGSRRELRPVGELTTELLQQLQDSERADEIADLFAKTPFGKELREAIHEYDGNFQKIENILDKYVFDELNGIDERVSKTVLTPTRVFINHLLDISNIKMLLRAKRKRYDAETCKSMLYAPGIVLSKWKLEQMCEAASVPELASELEGTKYFAAIKELIQDFEKTEDVSPLEIALDKYLLKLVIEIAIQYTTNAGPTIRYMVSHEYESRNLKTILRGLSEGLDYKRIMPLVIIDEED
jgi:vacuolar-type H+-ATPase subunit C/Vma6